LLWAPVVRGVEGQTRGDTGTNAPASGKREARRVEVAARATYADVRVGLLGAGVEGAYFLSPHFALGGSVDAFFVDSGADPDYSEVGSLAGGYHGMLSAEYDALDFWITPYARVAAGVGELTRIDGWRRPHEVEFVGQLQAGFVLRGGPLIARMSVAPTLYGSDSATTFSAAVGARF
jgi:hypothetical protein